MHELQVAIRKSKFHKIRELSRFGFEVHGYAMHPRTYGKLRMAIPDAEQNIWSVPHTLYGIPVYTDWDVSENVVEVLSKEEARKRYG